MEELRNPLLGSLNTEDLNQRYSDSYCLYFGEPRYIHNFAWNDDAMLVEWAPINIGRNHVQSKQEVFRWEGLNVARPQAGWYFGDHAKGLHPFHASYPVKRQYKRGLNTRNVTITSPYGRVPFVGMYYHSMLTAPEDYTNITDELFDSPRSVIPRRDRILVWKDAGWDFWYRNQHVAQIDPGKKVIFFRDMSFVQELMEVTRSPYLATFERVLDVPKAKEEVWYAEERPEDEDGEEPRERDGVDLDQVLGAVRGINEQMYIIDSLPAKNWVVETMLSKVAGSIMTMEAGVRPPVLKKIGRVLFNWEGIDGGGKIILHYSAANDVGLWRDHQDKKKLFLGYMQPHEQNYFVGIFHCDNPNMPAGQRDDLYVIYQKA